MARDNPPTLQMIVRVSDGSYESRLEMPVTATKEQIDNFAKMWIGALSQAVAITRDAQTQEGENRE